MSDKTPSQRIDGRIAELGDWRGETLAKLRALIHAAVPDVVEDWKWRGVPTWYANGKIICTGETYKAWVKLTFMKGAEVDDPKGLFNASLEGVRRAIDFREGDAVDEAGMKALFASAAALNRARKK